MAIRDRFKGAPWFKKKNESVIVGGAGGIGSWLVLLLVRAGFNPYVYDFDIIESHNIGGQFFTIGDIGKSKVKALYEGVSLYTGTSINIFDHKFDENTMGHRYMFSAFDNMEARKNMFNAWKKTVENNPSALFIDGRLLMEQMQIFCVTSENMDKYEREHLFDDSEVETENCTMKQTSHSATMIASLMVGFFTNHMANLVNGDKGRHLPFMYEYFIPLNLVTEEDGID